MPPRRHNFFGGLPDDILRCIIAFLPTKSAVGTSVISRQWIDWRTEVEFHQPAFDGSDLLEPGLSPDTIELSFQKFASDILDRVNLLMIRRFYLHCLQSYDAEVLRGWVVRGWTNNVVEVGIRVDNIDEDNFLNLPSNLCTSTALEVLKLQGNITLNPDPDQQDKHFDNEDNVWLTFEINTQNLVCLELRDSFLAQYTLRNLDLLGKADIGIGGVFMCPRGGGFDLDHWSDERISFLREDYNVKSLALSGCTVGEAIGEFPDCVQPWEEPDVPADCLRNCLGEISVRGFGGKLHEFQVIEYLLRNAPVLKRMDIYASAKGGAHSEDIKAY